MAFAEDLFNFKETTFDPKKSITLNSKNIDYFQSNTTIPNSIKYRLLLDLYKNVFFEKSFSRDKYRFQHIFL